MLRMKLTLVILALLLVLPGKSAPQIGRTVTVAAGTAVRIVTIPTIVNSVHFEMLHGGSGVGYVLFASLAVTCDKANANTNFVGEMAPATTTSPGGTWDLDRSQTGGFDLSNFCLDGSHTADTILATWDTRN